jgi:hypothetical protein
MDIYVRDAQRVKGLSLIFLIPLSGVGTTCFHHVMIKIRQLFLRPAACLTSTLLETGVATNANAAKTNGLICLPKHGGAGDNKFWSPTR